MNIYETWTKNDERVRIFYDEDAESPREFQSGHNTLVTRHKRYKLGDREPLSDTEYDERCADGTLVVLPVYIYEHSGITISTGAFLCPWDSGMIGFVFEKIEANETHEIVEKRLIEDIKLYSKFLEGVVFYFKRERKKTCPTCEHVTWEHVDSCGSFIGSPDESNLYEEAFPEKREGWTLTS